MCDRCVSVGCRSVVWSPYDLPPIPWCPEPMYEPISIPHREVRSQPTPVSHFPWTWTFADVVADADKARNQAACLAVN